MVNSDDQFRPIRMTESDDTKYPIGRREVIHHPAIQQSIMLCTGRYENAKFHISRQEITRSATEHDLIRPPTRVHPRTSVHSPQFQPYSPRVFIDPVCLGRDSVINGFMPKGPFGQCVSYIYIVCNSSHLVVDGQSRGSQVERGLDSPEDLQGEGASTGCRSQLYSAVGIRFYQTF
jgi:hypothetical protein